MALELGGPIEAEAQALAAELGSTVYEERLNLTAGLPAVVRVTPDREEAQRVLAGLRARRAKAVGFAKSAVVASDAMTLLRGFVLEPGAVVADAGTLAATSLLALVLAFHKSRTETRVETKEKKLSLGRALVTGGLAMRKTVTTERKEVSFDDEQVLYVFRRDGEPPWLLRERATGYEGLGAERDVSSAQNFAHTIRKLRALAPGAVFDDRLHKPRGFGGRTAPLTKTPTETSPIVDVLAHAIALAAARG